MTDHNRGAYTPQSEAPLAFDARRSRGERPFPLALLISAAILVVIVVALVVFLMRQPAGDEVAPDTGEVIDAMKVEPAQPLPPTAPGGMQVAVEDPLAAPVFTTPPEQPAPRATAPIAAAPAAPAPAPTTDPIGALMPKSASAPAAKATVAASPPSPKAPTAGGGAAQVQIGAFSSPALADKGWNDIAGLMPGQMAGKTKRVEQVEANGATLHRTFIGGFSSREQAQAFCDQLKSQGKSCLVR
jgi:cell division septation protein DedD